MVTEFNDRNQIVTDRQTNTFRQQIARSCIASHG